jgi:hypothetical protein
MRRTLPLALLLLAPAALAGQDDRPEEPCSPKPGTGVVVGTVVDSTTSIPLEGAGVSVRWQANARVDYWENEEGETDGQGRFRVCDAPRNVPLVVRAGFWGDRSKELDATIADSATTALVLLVDGPHSLLAGRVLDAQSNEPVVGAEVRFGRIAEVRITDADGAFQFGRVPPGSYEVEIRHLAFTTLRDTLDVDVAAGVNATIRVAPGVIPIDPISVVIRSLVLERAGFYERRERSSGHFVTRQDVEDQRPLRPSEILRRVPGVRLLSGRNGITAVARANCPFRFVIDGTRTGPDYSIDLIPSLDIEGLEIYLGPSQVPGEFSGFGSDVGGTCGVIVVWTRRNLKI